MADLPIEAIKWWHDESAVMQLNHKYTQALELLKEAERALEKSKFAITHAFGQAHAENRMFDRTAEKHALEIEKYGELREQTLEKIRSFRDD